MGNLRGGRSSATSRVLTGGVVVLLCCALALAGCGTTIGGSASVRSVAPTSSTPGSASPPVTPPTAGTGAPVPTTPDRDRPLPSVVSTVATGPTAHTGPPVPTVPGAGDVPSPYQLQVEHDTAFAALLGTLSSAVTTGDESRFLVPFTAALTGRERHWFDNTRALGVDRALFAPEDDYSSAATDGPDSFTRSVVLGVRTPYDDTDSMPGIVYSATVSVRAKMGRPVLTVTSWKPKYLGDPMDCDCLLRVVHTSTTAVVAPAADNDLVYWSTAALGAAGDGISWSYRQMQGAGLVAPRGQVIFLADKPFHWFLTLSGPGQSSNVTAGLVDALGSYPGSRYSDQSRIVLMLEASDGTIVPNDQQGREYVSDVITHESTHQLMNRNSELPGRSPTSPPTWVVEGIAVAVETLHRDALGEQADIGYPEPNDPKNIDPDWFVEHLTDTMPTQSELYSSDGAGYYAIAGSVFRYLDREYGYVDMMTVAKAMYAKPGRTPFSYFPDPDHRGAMLPTATAQSRWKAWFAAQYE